MKLRASYSDKYELDHSQIGSYVLITGRYKHINQYSTNSKQSQIARYGADNEP